MEQSEGLISSLASQSAGSVILPPKVERETENEKVEYEKELLSGAGSLMTGSAVEKGLKALKGKTNVLKKLGVGDEDIAKLSEAISKGDKGAIVDFFQQKGVGAVNKAIKTGTKAVEGLKEDVQGAIKTGQKAVQNLSSESINTSKLGDLLEQGKGAITKSPLEIPKVPSIQGGDTASGDLDEASQSLLRTLQARAKPPISGNPVQEGDAERISSQIAKSKRADAEIDDMFQEAKPNSFLQRIGLLKKNEPTSKLSSLEEDFKSRAKAERESYKGSRKKKVPRTDEETPQAEEQGSTFQEELSQNLPDTLLDVFDKPKINPRDVAPDLDVEEGAGFSRGGLRIPANTEIDDPEDSIVPASPKLPSEGQGEQKQAQEQQEEEEQEQQSQKVSQQKEQVQEEQQQEETQTQQQNIQAEQQDKTRSKDIEEDEEGREPMPDEEGIPKPEGEGEDFESGLKKALEGSLEDDESPIGIAITGALGIASLIGGLVQKSHHHNFVQPPALMQPITYSVQGGV